MEHGAYEEMRKLEDHHWWFRGRRRMVRPFLRGAARPGDATVVEIGCGTGGNFSLLRECFGDARIVGIDLDKGGLAFCRERGHTGRLLRANGLRLPLRTASVDCLVALDFIEHVDDDGALLAEFQRVLKPGGRLVASVPAYPSLWSPHDDFLHHKRRYRTDELEGKLLASGFRVQRHNGFNFLLLVPIMLVRWIKSRGASGEPSGTDFFELPRPLNALVAALFVIEEWVVRIIRVPFGVSFLIRAEKS